MNIFLVMNYGAINIENVPDDFKLDNISLEKLGSILLNNKTGIPIKEIKLERFEINPSEEDINKCPVRVHVPFDFTLIKR